MPRIARPRVEGQTLRYTLNTGKDLSDATVVRLDYEYKDAEGGIVQGYWDESDGVTVVETKKIRFVHANIPRGIISVTTHAEWATGWVSLSPDPVIFTVQALGKRP